MIGTSVRFRNVDVFKFIMSDDNSLNNDQDLRETSIEEVLKRCTPPDSKQDAQSKEEPDNGTSG